MMAGATTAMVGGALANGGMVNYWGGKSGLGAMEKYWVWELQRRVGGDAVARRRGGHLQYHCPPRSAQRFAPAGTNLAQNARLMHDFMAKGECLYFAGKAQAAWKESARKSPQAQSQDGTRDDS